MFCQPVYILGVYFSSMASLLPPSPVCLRRGWGNSPFRPAVNWRGLGKRRIPQSTIKLKCTHILGLVQQIFPGEQHALRKKWGLRGRRSRPRKPHNPPPTPRRS